MRHLLDVEIGSFRGIRGLTLTGLGSVNLLVGGNNTGKTSILEAIELLCNPLSISRFIETSRGRDRAFMMNHRTRMPLENSIEWLFPLSPVQATKTDEEFPARLKIQIEGEIHGHSHNYSIDFYETSVIKDVKSFHIDERSEIRALEISMQHSQGGIVEGTSFLTTELPRDYRAGRKALLSTKMVTPVDHRMIPIATRTLTELFQRDKNGLIQLLHQFDPDILGIELLSLDGRSMIPHLFHRYKSYVPVSVYGDGMRRVLTLASAVIQARRGVLLIDEIETALHPRMLGKVFTWLVEACEHYDVQLFATTHSLEAIDAVVETFVDLDLDTEEVSLNRLQRLVGYRMVPGFDTVSKRFTGKDLYSLRHEYGQDVR